MTIFEVSESVLIQLEGRIDSTNAVTLQQKLTQLKPDRHTLWILDMEQVDFIDSAGLVALVAGLKAAHRHGCRLALCNVHPPVRLLFEITQLDRVFEIFDNLTDLAESGSFAEPVLSLSPEPAAA